MPTPYDKKEWFTFNFGTLAYVFRRVDFNPSSIATDLGLVKIATGSAPLAGCFEINSPKLPKARKRISSGSITSFYDLSKKAALQADGWTTGLARYRRVIPAGAAGYKSVTVHVTIGGIKYAWNMPLFTHANISADLTGLGVDIATAADTKSLIWGASYPKPAKVSKFAELPSSGGAVFHTFCSAAKEDSLPVGWSVKEPSRLMQDIIGT